MSSFLFLTEIKAAPQSCVQSSGSSVIISARGASNICTSIISGCQISGLSMNVNIALGTLHDIICRQETARPDAVFIVAADFNHCNLRNVLPMYHQHVRFPTRENNILDQVYSNGRPAAHHGVPQRSQGAITAKITLPDELNEFYARVEAPNTSQQHKILASEGILDTPLMVSSAEVRMTLKRTSPWKAAGPDNIPWRALRVCSLELADVLTDIYNLSFAQASVPSCFKSTTIVPLPKKNTVTCLNDYRPLALTPAAMKCFERIVMTHIKRTIPATLDPFQFAYRQNRSTDDAVNDAIQTALTHLEGKDTYVRMLFIDYSSAFNTVIPHRLSKKLLALGLTPSLCNWVLNFLTDRPQSVRVGNRTSGIRTTNTRIIKFADDTTVIGLITGGEATSYRREVAGLIAWCQENNLYLNIDKTKEMIIDPRRRRKEQHTPVYIGETEVERVKTFKFLGIYSSKDLTWSHNTQQLLRRSQQRLYFLRRLRKFGMSTEILSNF
ncbi:hypothetical protein PGIGA_G00218730 [Pangasianodon gigas]|uniref:Uncharacterized protein n=1 Tax=Pangasianodon gigas TaxID=30993 RepID=A0ACC5WHY2_PANGG|nr:hypothetical protein [Pangasianodon gigas]